MPSCAVVSRSGGCALFTPLAAGQVRCFQGWFREPSLQPASALSNAWTVALSY